MCTQQQMPELYLKPCVNGVKVHLPTRPKLKLPPQCAEAGCSVAMVMMLMMDGECLQVSAERKTCLTDKPHNIIISY